MQLVYLLYALSGLISLGYQAAWFRIFVDRFGSTNLTFVLVVCNFIAGLGLGALVSKRFCGWLADRCGLHKPLRVYGAVEVLIVLAAAVTLLTPRIPADFLGHFPYRLIDGVYQQTHAYVLMRVGIAAGCVFVPCLLMGVTFPLLCYAYRSNDRFPSALYGWNTFGACAGVLAFELLIVPRLGHDGGFVALLGLNLALGLFFLLFGARIRTDSPAALNSEPTTATSASNESAGASVLLACAILSGFLAGALEGDAFRRIWFIGCSSGPSMPFISFWAIAAIFLASWTVRFFRRLSFTHIKIGLALALVCYLLAWQYRRSIITWLSVELPTLMTEISDAAEEESPSRGHYSLFGDNPLGLLAFVGLFIFPAYYLVSLLLPYVCNRIQSGRRHLGVAYGLNTVAFCMGMLAFAWLAPYVNIFYSLKLFGWVFGIGVALVVALRLGGRVTWWKPALAVAGLVVACRQVSAVFDTSMLAASNLATRFPVTSMKSNGAHTSYVVNTPRGKMLYFDHHSMSATAPDAQRYMRLMAHFPLIAHPDPRTALLICFGVGNTASAIACHDTIERIDAVDLNDRVFETAPEFASTNGRVFEDERISLIHDDGRNFLRLTDRTYDLITSEPPPPMQEGVYRLYTTDYYESVLAHLTPDGMMTQWLPIEQMPPRAVQMAVSSFVAAFPHTLLFAGSNEQFILIGSPSPINLANLERRFDSQPRAAEDLAALRIRSPLHLIARIVRLEADLEVEYGDGDVLRDRHNDFTYTFHSPDRRAEIRYDPVVVLNACLAGGITDIEMLRPTLTNLAMLKYEVRDFPDSSLMTVKDAASGAVSFADADWVTIGRLNWAAGQASSRKDWGKAAGLFGRSLSMVPDQPSALAAMGRIQLRQGRLNRALQVWKRFTELVPDEAVGHRNVGLALIRAGRTREALPHIKEALRLDPDDQAAKKLLEMISSHPAGAAASPGGAAGFAPTTAPSRPHDPASSAR